MVLALTLVAFLLSGMKLVQTKGQDILAWAVLALALGLLWTSLPLR